MLDLEKQSMLNIKENKDESEITFETLYDKYSEDALSSEKIHEFAQIEIKDRENEIVHKIDIINENPEVRIENYCEIIAKVYSRAYEIHPEIVKEIEKIIFTDHDKERFLNDEDEKKASEGLMYAANAQRSGVKNQILYLTYRSFKTITPRYEKDNPDVKSNSEVSHFEMIFGHELFHNLNVLSQYEDSKYRDIKDDNLDKSNKFDWMNGGYNENTKSLEFTGILSSKNYNNIVDSEGNIENRYKDFVKFKNIKNKEGEDVKCQINDGDLLRPEKDIIYPERFISNYSREQVEKNGEEDFCDSMVAYAFDPKFLKEFDKKRGTKKFEWLEKRWGLYSKEKLDNPEIKMDIYKKDSESTSWRTE